MEHKCETFEQRLIKLREEKGYSQDELASKVGVTQQTLSRYEKGQRQATIEFVVKAARIFNVSTDYLLGFSDNSTTNPDIKNACEVTGLSERVINNITDFQKLKILPEIKDFWNNNMDDIIENDYFLGLYFNIANMYIASKEYVESVLNGTDQKEIIGKETMYKVEVFQCTETFRKLIDDLRFPLYEKAYKYYNLSSLIGEDADRFKPSESDWLNLKQLFDEEVSKYAQHNPTSE